MGKEARLVQVVRRSLKAVFSGTDPLVLVALSGGVDSVALLGAVKSLVDAGVVRAVAIHVDHGVRAESTQESAAVTTFAQSLGFNVLSTRLEDDLHDRFPGVGIEEALRRGRYLAFRQFFVDAGADLVALGHHQQDQAETVLMHILRGSGLRGAVGMTEFSTIEVPWWAPFRDDRDVRSRVPLWRPFLDTPKQDLAAFVAERGWPHWEDASNQDRMFRRNAIRHDVLPLLEGIYPGSTGTLARFGQILDEDDAELDTMARTALEEHIGEVTLPRDVLRRQSAVIRRRMVRMWILRQVPGLELSFQRVQAVADAVAHTGSGAVIEIGQGWSVTIGRDLVVLGSGGA